MDGTHGSTDEEMIYHSAGTQSGQYVDDREFRRLIEDAGYVPVRRNSTYDEFPYDWTPPAPQGDKELVTRLMHGLRCGRIIYTNDLPIYAAFDAGAIEYPGTLHADVPAKLNAMLLSGELDLSPISAFAWAKNADDLVLLPDLCIGARDEVVSVVLVSETAAGVARRRRDRVDR